MQFAKRFHGGLMIPLCMAALSAAAPALAAEPAPAEKNGSQKSAPTWQAFGYRIPEEIVMVVSQGSNGPANIMVAGWFMPAGGAPDSLAVAIAKERHTHKLIMETRQFVIAFPGENIEKEMLFCGTKSGRDFDKFKETKLTARPSKKVKPPLIDECIVNFECEMTHAVEVGTHTIFVGKIVNAWEHENAKSIRKLYTLGGLGGHNYGAWPLPAKDEAAPEKPKEKPAQASGKKSD